jgi:hypothetical protein
MIADLLAFADENEPQLIACDLFINENESTMTCVALHPDSASMEFYMEMEWEIFRPFSEHIDQRSIDVYGQASEADMARLH